MTVKRHKKRFIAGATCPNCHAQDTLMLYLENNVEKVSCVRCNYEKSQVADKVEAKSGDGGNVIGIFRPE